jgi:hypothetical protein
MIMKLMLESDKDIGHIKEEFMIRLTALNDSYDIVSLDRRLLIGPNVVQEVENGVDFRPVSVEPSLPVKEQNIVNLSPWSLYGRERSFNMFKSGKMIAYGYLLRQQSKSLLPQRPGNVGDLLASAEPLILSITD